MATHGTAISVLTYLLADHASGGNPLVPGVGTADPHVHAFGGRLYMYSTHDLGPNASTCCMGPWWIWSSADLVNWRHEASMSPLQWAPEPQRHQFWATDATERNGAYYWYVSVGGRRIGVVNATSPSGPWHDPLGKALFTAEDGSSYNPQTSIRDPGVLKDVDGRYYITFGACSGDDQPDDSCYYLAELNEDMVSYKQPRHLSVRGAMGPYGPGKCDDKPFLHVRAGVYYLSWGVFYATATTPYGPYEYRGTFIDEQLIAPDFRVGNMSAEPWYSRADFGDRHGSFLELNGQWYFFCNDYSHGSHTIVFRVAVATYVHYFDNGTIAPIVIDAQGVANHDVEAQPSLPAENYFAIQGPGASKREAPHGGFEIAGLRSGSTLSYTNFRGVSFFRNRHPVRLRVSNGGICSGSILVTLKRSVDDQEVAECIAEAIPTGSWQRYADVPCEPFVAAAFEGLSTEALNLHLSFSGCETEFARLDEIVFATSVEQWV